MLLLKLLQDIEKGIKTDSVVTLRTSGPTDFVVTAKAHIGGFYIADLSREVATGARLPITAEAYLGVVARDFCVEFNGMVRQAYIEKGEA